MKRFDHILDRIPNEEYFRKICGGNGIFLDIETTGLKKESCSVYLIGLLYPGESFTLSLLFAEKTGEECLILSELSRMTAGKEVSLITFNGRHFDLPFLIKRYEVNGITPPAFLSDGSDTDIYALIRPYRRSFGLSSLNQKAVEKLLGIEREDSYSGGELIGVYHDYVKTGNKGLLDLLLTHNRDDVLCMAEILPVLSYAKLFSAAREVLNIGLQDCMSFNIKGASYDCHMGFDGSKEESLCISFDLPEPVPKPHLFHNLRLFLETREDTGVLRVPVMETELKHFFKNHKDYYYIPSEDKAVLKTIGNLMTDTELSKATARTCYIRTSGRFLPLPSGFSPEGYTVYRQDYDSRAGYVLLYDDVPDDGFLKEYLVNLLAGSFDR